MDKRSRNLKRRNRARFRKTLVFLIIISLFSLSIYSLNMFFKIKNIVIYDNLRYENSYVIDFLDIGDDHNLLFFNKDKMADEIVGYFPYIQSVEIERKYPDTLEIFVQNAKELCSFHYQGVSYLVDYDLSILRPITISESQQFFRIFGLDSDDFTAINDSSAENTDRLKLLKEVIDAFDDNAKIYGITEINIAKIYDVRVKFAGKYEIYLGDADDLSHKMKFLDEVLKKLTPSDVGVIDISNSAEARFRPVEIPNSPYPEIDEEIGDVIPYFDAPPTIELVVQYDGENFENTDETENFDVLMPDFDVDFTTNNEFEDIETFDVLMPENYQPTNTENDVVDLLNESFDVLYVETRESFGPELQEN